MNALVNISGFIWDQFVIRIMPSQVQQSACRMSNEGSTKMQTGPVTSSSQWIDSSLDAAHDRPMMDSQSLERIYITRAIICTMLTASRRLEAVFKVSTCMFISHLGFAGQVLVQQTWAWVICFGFVKLRLTSYRRVRKGSAPTLRYFLVAVFEGE